jgi:hypothetical protein
LQEIREDLGLADLIVFVGSRSQEVCALLLFGLRGLRHAFAIRVIRHGGAGGDGLRHTGYCFARGRATSLCATARRVSRSRKDPKALADKLELLLTNDCLRRRLGHRATEVAAGFSWSVVADDIEALYAELGVSPS